MRNKLLVEEKIELSNKSLPSVGSVLSCVGKVLALVKQVLSDMCQLRGDQCWSICQPTLGQHVDCCSDEHSDNKSTYGIH